MSWFLSLLLALLAGGVGLVAGGLVMSACVGWYRVSSFEGKAGYAVVAVALLGGIAGFVLGLVVARLVPDASSHPFLLGLALAVGVVLLLALMAAALARGLADVPPRLDGKELHLDVEVRLPVDREEPPVAEDGEAYVELGALRGRVRRTAVRGELLLDDARREDGRWILPGSVHVFTSRGRRMLSVHLGSEPVFGFLVPLPARPGRRFLAWSEWGPRPRTPNPPWPDTKTSYRFRVCPVEPPPPGPTREEEAAAEREAAQARFEAMPADAPVAAWIPWTRPGSAPEHREAALARIAARPSAAEELACLLRSEDLEAAAEALRLVEHVHDASLVSPVAAAGRALAERIRRVNATTPEEDPACLAAADASVLFRAWMVAVRALRERCGGDFTPELGEILTLARVRTDSPEMRLNVVRVASWAMHQWAGVEPLPTDPKPT